MTQADLAARWPDVVRVPKARLRAAVTRKLLMAATNRLPIRVELHDRGGIVLKGAGGPADPLMRVLRPEDFFARVATGGLIGIGEAYLAGDWEPGPSTTGQRDGLVDVLTVYAAELPRLIPQRLQKLRRFAVRRQPHAERNTPDGARSNISRHYDLSNDMFETFLDETLTYSAAMFDPAKLAPAWADLPAAQGRKIERLLDACRVGSGSRVLEIGTGWGELALRAARRGATVHSITLSEEQLKLARERVAEAGFADAVTIELCDYRMVEGEYDAVLSVEMIEAVGEQYWPVYFGKLSDVLAPGGRVGLQAITMPHDRMVASRTTYTWIHKYVFPGGLIPSVRAIREAGAAVGLAVVDDVAFADGYAETLRLWRERFNDRADDVARLGFDPLFRRMWNFYLAYSEAGFRSRYLDVHQFVLTAGAGR
ncbi:class I SAM-dependent methyltransferase [Spongisporangium articulatum]|uniref:Class I SAM-dependent methyltransferase n=1 Tax=Spongisporangium articulatum TaxID=3362603 RepID=A0ABW8AP86_9ACTN